MLQLFFHWLLMVLMVPRWEAPPWVVAPFARMIHQKLGARFQQDESRQLAKVDLLEWGCQFLPDYFVHPPSLMHRWLSTELGQLQAYPRKRGVKINVIGPRGGAKSTLGTLAFVLRTACEATEPYIWIVSDTQQQAQLHLDNLKTELTSNPRLAKAYPNACGQGPRWRASAIELPNGVVIEAIGTGQRIRGRRRRAHRPTLIVGDDLQNDSHIGSPLQRETSDRWFHGTLLKAGTSATHVIHLATALHRDALAMQLQTTPGWQSKLFRSLESWPEHLDLWQQWENLYSRVDLPDASQQARDFYQQHQTEMDRGAVLLWPEVEDLYTLMAMRVESGATAFEREKQGSPVDPESCEWPEEYFAEHVWFDHWPDDLVLRTLALDPSKGGDARRGDYSAFVMLGIDPQGVLYIEADLARRPTPQMVTDGVALCQLFQPTRFGVESNQWQELLAAEFIAEFRRQGLLDIQPAMIANYTNKRVRIRRLGPYLSQRRMRFKRGSPSTKLLIDQLRDFPFGAHDDGPDALEMALRLAEDHWQGKHSSP